MTRVLFYIERSMFPTAILFLYMAHGGGMPLLGAIALGYVTFKVFLYAVHATEWLLRPIGLEDFAWVPAMPASLVIMWIILRISQVGM